MFAGLLAVLVVAGFLHVQEGESVRARDLLQPAVWYVRPDPAAIAAERAHRD